MTILVWIRYLDLLYGLVDKIKKYFDIVECIDYKLNNFILNIKNSNNQDNKCDSYIFGIIEGYKKIFQIEEYAYSLTTLETVFLKFCCNQKNNNKNNSKKNKEEKKFNIIL